MAKRVSAGLQQPLLEQEYAIDSESVRLRALARDLKRHERDEGTSARTLAGVAVSAGFCALLMLLNAITSFAPECNRISDFDTKNNTFFLKPAGGLYQGTSRTAVWGGIFIISVPDVAGNNTVAPAQWGNVAGARFPSAEVLLWIAPHTALYIRDITVCEWQERAGWLFCALSLQVDASAAAIC